MVVGIVPPPLARRNRAWRVVGDDHPGDVARIVRSEADLPLECASLARSDSGSWFAIPLGRGHPERRRGPTAYPAPCREPLARRRLPVRRNSRPPLLREGEACIAY